MTTTGDDQLVFSGPFELAELVRSRQLKPRELVELCLRRIETLDPRLNAFRVTLAEEALAAADAAEGSDGLLAGVPIAVKDDLPVKGQVTTKGSRTYGPPAEQDAEAVRRLRAAGAIPIGITNVPELMIFPWTTTQANGVTRNPWDPSRTTGGSSGGSAAAVASGMVPCATASDGGGSIRIPAGACGLVGMKPTRGRVSTHPMGQGWLALSVYGALARTVRDSALLLDAMHGAIEGDADSAPRFEGSYVEAAANAPQRLRIAISKKVPPGLIAKISADQRGAWERTAKALEGLGHEVVERDPAYGLFQLDFLQMWLRGIYEDAQTLPDQSQLEKTTRQMVWAGGRIVSERRRDKLLAKRPGTIERLTALWNQVDILLTPGLAKTAIDAEGGFGKAAPLAIDMAGRFTPYTPVFNLTGQPAITIPAGMGSDGLPLCVQLVGRHGAEDVLYGLAGQLEAASPWADWRPPLS
jgi:amidase